MAMLYTVGHAESYERYFREQDQPMKLGRCPHPDRPYEEYPGGSAYETREEAQAWCPDGYAVYGLATDLSNTHVIKGHRFLIDHAPLVQLS